MEQYISKAVLVAEIERRKEYYENIQMIKPVYESNIEDFNELLSFLDTFKEKEVDFEKIWKEYFKYRGDVTTVNVKHLAKHFFELGLKVAQKGELNYESKRNA